MKHAVLVFGHTIVWALIAVLILLAGCGPNLAEVFTALAKDPATVKLDITTPWGSFHLDRSSPGAMQVPIVVVPGVGAPMVTAPVVK